MLSLRLRSLLYYLLSFWTLFVPVSCSPIYLESTQGYSAPIQSPGGNSPSSQSSTISWLSSNFLQNFKGRNAISSSSSPSTIPPGGSEFGSASDASTHPSSPIPPVPLSPSPQPSTSANSPIDYTLKDFSALNPAGAVHSPGGLEFGSTSGTSSSNANAPPPNSLPSQVNAPAKGTHDLIDSGVSDSIRAGGVASSYPSNSNVKAPIGAPTSGNMATYVTPAGGYEVGSTSSDASSGISSSDDLYRWNKSNI